MTNKTEFWQNAAGDLCFAQIDGWRIETYETVATMIAQRIISPAGRTADARWIGHDGRLSSLRTSANIEFASDKLKLSDALVDKMIVAAQDYMDRQVAVEPEFALTDI